MEELTPTLVRLAETTRTHMRSKSGTTSSPRILISGSLTLSGMPSTLPNDCTCIDGLLLRLLCNRCDQWISVPPDDHLQAVQGWLNHRGVCNRVDGSAGASKPLAPYVFALCTALPLHLKLTFVLWTAAAKTTTSPTTTIPWDHHRRRRSNAAPKVHPRAGVPRTRNPTSSDPPLPLLSYAVGFLRPDPQHSQVLGQTRIQMPMGFRRGAEDMG